MGLDCSHDAFHGAYSAFNRLRQAIAKVMGGSFPPHETEFHADGDRLERDLWYWGDGFTPESHPGLHVFLAHSDCDGEIRPDDCVTVANDLEALLPKLDEMGGGTGHLAAAGGYAGATRLFIAGCRDAAAAGETLTFR